MTAVLILTGCANTTTPGGGTTAVERRLCQIWGESLPTRARADTRATQDGIAATYADFAAACPDRAHLIP